MPVYDNAGEEEGSGMVGIGNWVLGNRVTMRLGEGRRGDIAIYEHYFSPQRNPSILIPTSDKALFVTVAASCSIVSGLL